MKSEKIERKIIIKYILIILAVFAFFGIWMHYFKDHLNYIEYNEYYSSNGISSITLTDGTQELIQEFEMPYDRLWGVELKIGTYERNNNSNWRIRIIDKETAEVVDEQVFNASFLTNDEFYRIRVGTGKELKKGNIYELHISSDNVTEATAIAFYTSEIPAEVNTSLSLNGTPTNSSLFMKIYGGDTDGWWTCFSVFCLIMILLMVGYCFYLEVKGKSVRRDSIVQAMLVCVLVFILLSAFSGVSTFTDENDNIRGGMILARGGVLYRDYIVQHTPVMYFLCALFAKLGAECIQQFRLLYDVVIALIWGLVYLRNKKNFGGGKMLLLPLAEIIFMVSVFQERGYMILSDNVQGLCMVVLILEFLQYYRDKKIDLLRAVIVSLCIWISIGVAFVSAYAVFAVAVAVVIYEIRVVSMKILPVRTLIIRYVKLIVACLVPGACMIGYFAANGVEQQAYDMIYRFNTEVYSWFLDGFGTNKLYPFFKSLQSFFEMIANTINTIVTGKFDNIIIIQLVIVALLIVNLVYQIAEKRYGVAVVTFLTMCFSSTRGFDDFHCIPFWAVAILIVVILGIESPGYKNKLVLSIIGCVAILLSAGFGSEFMNTLTTEREPVCELEHEVVKQTEEGEGILIDTYSLDSIYLLSKDRYPINANTYFLPWYMQWYEQSVIDQMNQYQPRIAVYNLNVSAWGYENYTDSFEAALQMNYTQYSELQMGEKKGWMKKLWIRN